MEMVKNKYMKKTIVSHNGEIPQDPNELRRIPGVGPYTAGA